MTVLPVQHLVLLGRISVPSSFESSFLPTPIVHVF